MLAACTTRAFGAAPDMAPREAATAPRGVPPARPPKRSLWWTVHHWLGLKLSLFMTFILLTGTLAVFAHELDWLFDADIRVAPRSEPHASWGAWAAAVQGAEPNGTIVAIAHPIDPWFAAQATVARGPDQRVFVYVNPWTAEVQGTGPWFNIHRFFRNTHRHLMLPVKYGVPIVCSLAFVLIASLVTGLVAYKKFWRGFGRVPRWRAGRAGELRRFTGEAHRFMALWSLWFVALIAATGVWYLVEELGGEAPPLPRPERKTEAAQPVGAELDRLLAAAQASYPELRVRGLSFPEDGGRGLNVQGQARAVLVRERANAVWVEPATGEVLGQARGEDLGLHQRISEMADPLHFGSWGGLTTKVVWFVFGAALTGLSVTGVMIYSLRLKRAEMAGAGRRGSVRKVWDGMGPFAYPAVALILISLALTPMAMSGGG